MMVIARIIHHFTIITDDYMGISINGDTPKLFIIPLYCLQLPWMTVWWL